MNARNDLRPMGVVRGMPFDEYLSVNALSASGMKHLARSPWHYANRVDIKQTRPMLNGTLAHCALLEPDALAQRYVVVPRNAPKRPTEAQWNAKKSNEDSMIAKEWWTAFSEEAAGRIVIPADDFEVTQLQLAAVASNTELSALLARGYSEASLFWIDEETGVYCKARPDWLNDIDDEFIDALDLKSTVDESPNGFGRTVARMGYGRQQAHYVNGIEAVTGKRVRNFVFGAVTSARPVLAVPYLLPEEFAEQCRDEVRDLYAVFAECQANDFWPSYGTGFMLADIPAYANRSNEIEVSDVL